MHRPIILLFLILGVSSCYTPRIEPPHREPSEAAGKEYSRPLPPGAHALRRIEDPSRIPDFGLDALGRKSLVPAVRRSLDYLAKPSSHNHFPMQQFRHEDVRRSLERFLALLETTSTPRELDRSVRLVFDVYQSIGCDDRGTVLFTGYCQPIYDASLTETSTFRYPLYRLPPDLVKGENGQCLGRRNNEGTVTPQYFTRREIEEGNLLRGLELAYLKDPLEAYIVHVQGSAKLRLPSGEIISVGYAGKTNHPYQSIGKALNRDGKLKRGQHSLTGIKRYFKDHPGDLKSYLYKNERYIFFLRNEGGPYGSLGQPVTSHRTIATDKSIFPRASLCFIDTKIPQVTATGRVAQMNLRAFVLDQDTGGAIRSPGRCDIFLGTGEDAERIAGFTHAEGKLYYLFLKDLGNAAP